MSIQVSVVVPTCNRPEMLQRCLEALIAQDIDPASYEIIVVDDAPSPRTRRVVESFHAEPAYALGLTARLPARLPLTPLVAAVPTPADSWRQVPSPALDQMPGRHLALGLTMYQTKTGPAIFYLPHGRRHGPAAARNIGWRAALGEIIAFTDDDTIPSFDWLRRGLACFSESISGVSGRVVVPLPEQPTDYEKDVAGLEHSHFVTANCFYRRSALALVNGFDERFRMAWREDSDLYFRLLDNGHRLVEAPQAVVIHPVRPAGWGVSLRQQRKSMYNALLYKKHPRHYRRLQASPPWHYYATLVALLGMLAGGLAGLPALLGTSAGAWAALTLSFFFRRLHNTSHQLPHVVEMAITSILIPPISIFWRLCGALRFRVFFL